MGQNAGFNAYKLRTWDGLHRGDRPASCARRARSTGWPRTQDHHAIDKVGAAEIQKRVPGLVREGTFEQYTNEPEFVDHLGIHSPPLISLWKEWEYTGHKWGMAIDLNTCTGCNACVLGCQSENNIPVVGKDQVARGREMAWVRLDRYFLGDADDPTLRPAAGGLRAVRDGALRAGLPGGRHHAHARGPQRDGLQPLRGHALLLEQLPLQGAAVQLVQQLRGPDARRSGWCCNPDVTVRARGVMEKCTYCVQRIEAARIDRPRRGARPMRDGDITPACAQTCPTDAIVFGDLNDTDSRVSKLRELTRSYDLLDYLNIKPRTFYLARLRNPNPAIAGTERRAATARRPDMAATARASREGARVARHGIDGHRQLHDRYAEREPE